MFTRIRILIAFLFSVCFLASAEDGVYVISNGNGCEAVVSGYGARLLSLKVPDNQGAMRDVVLGFDTVEEYDESWKRVFGATIGRYANRISDAYLKIGSEEYQLSRNEGANCIHGGETGWHMRNFDLVEHDAAMVVLELISPDGEMGFPGTVHFTVSYFLSEDNALHIRYRATTDKATVINVTNHSFFNLSGNPSSSGLEHILYINADRITPFGKNRIPTGAFEEVSGSPMDFRTPRRISEALAAGSMRSFDHNFVLNTGGDLSVAAARLFSPESGICMEVFTTEPGMQLYTGFVPSGVAGKGSVVFHRTPSVCLETQHFPDSPGRSGWPSVLLNPDEEFVSETVYLFAVE